MAWSVEDTFYLNQDDWLLPLDENLGHLKETANPEEFHVYPEDVDLEPENIQSGVKQWTSITEE